MKRIPAEQPARKAASRNTKVVFPPYLREPTLAVVSAQQSRGKQVLLVDDDASLRRALTRTIRLAGFDVESFATGESLLSRGVCALDACLVLDVDLPGMNGFECKRMLDAAGGPRVPTIFITALPSADVDASLAAFAPVAVLYKPFDKDDLLDAVERACG